MEEAQIITVLSVVVMILFIVIYRFSEKFKKQENENTKLSSKNYDLTKLNEDYVAKYNKIKEKNEKLVQITKQKMIKIMTSQRLTTSDVEKIIYILYNDEPAKVKEVLTKVWDVWPDYPPDWQWRRFAIMDRDKRTCQICKKPAMRGECHHIIPLSKGGTHVLDNLEWVHRECHEIEHGRYFNERFYEDKNQNYDPNKEYANQVKKAKEIENDDFDFGFHEEPEEF